MDTRRVPADPRYLKTPDGSVYGPVDALTLCAWAADARVTPGCQVSVDGRAWKAATEYPELRLHWQASLADGTTVGPLNLFALWELIQDGSLPRGVSVRHCVTGEEVPLDERLLPVALKESRDLIQVMATQMAGALSTAPAPESETLRARLAQAEKDLAENLRLMGETQRLLLSRDRQIQTLEQRDAQREARATPVSRTEETARAGQPTAPELDAIRVRLAAAEKELADVRQQRDAAQRQTAERGCEVDSLKVSLAEAGERLAATERQMESIKAEAEAAVRGISDELERARADVAALRDSRDQAAAAWETERAEFMRRCGEAETLALTRGETAVAAEVRAQDAQRRLDSVQQAAQALQAEWEKRLAEAGQAAAEVAAQAQADRRLLEQRLEAAEHLRATLAAECAGLHAAVALAAVEKDQTGARLAEVERNAREAAAEHEMTRQRLADVERAGLEALGREAAARAVAEAEAAAGLERYADREAATARLAEAQAQAESVWNRERDALQGRVAELEQTAAAAQGDIAAREARLAELTAAYEAAQAAAGQSEGVLRERGSRLERELEQTIRRLGEAKGEATGLRQSLADERVRSAETAKRLAGELKGVQRDLHALNLVKTVNRQIRNERPNEAARSTIDWLAAGAAAAQSAATQATEPQDKFAGLELHDQVGVLHEELKASIGDKERLRLELDKLRTDHEDLQRGREDAERDFGAKIAQLKNEVESGGAVLQQTMEELEKREGAWRLARKRAEEREKELTDRVAALEAEIAKKAEDPPVVLHGEWQSPSRTAEPPKGDAAPTASAALGTVEAQLQTELHKWDSLNRDKDRKAEKTRNWFRWKQP